MLSVWLARGCSDAGDAVPICPPDLLMLRVAWPSDADDAAMLRFTPSRDC